ncbi:MAG: copper-binding protein [Alphaproteobacteria bacterium]
MRTRLLAAAIAALIAAPAAAQVIDGEVRRIDAAAGKITLRHGPMPHLDMDSMTMVFRVRDPALLKGLKVGDKVSFEAGRVDGALTVTGMQKR